MSTSLQPVQIPVAPELKDVLDLLKKDILLSFNCHAIGTIQSFNSAEQSAQVQINYPKTLYLYGPNSQSATPTQVPYPVLLECPVVIIGGGPASLTFPIAKGDECLVLFNDRDIDNWFQGGPGAPVATPRLHSFSDALVLVGLRSLARSIANYDSARALITDGNVMIGINPSTHKLTAQNASYDLGSLLQNLITQIETLCTDIKAITVTCAGSGSPSSPPINSAAFTTVSSALSNIATELGGLLE